MASCEPGRESSGHLTLLIIIANSKRLKVSILHIPTMSAGTCCATVILCRLSYCIMPVFEIRMARMTTTGTMPKRARRARARASARLLRNRQLGELLHSTLDLARALIQAEETINAGSVLVQAIHEEVDPKGLAIACA